MTPVKIYHKETVYSLFAFLEAGKPAQILLLPPYNAFITGAH